MDRTDPELRTDERTSIEQFLDYHRATLISRIEGLTIEQLSITHPPSELTLAGLIKHVAHTEATWAAFAERGPEAFGRQDWSPEAWAAEWRLGDGETLAGLLAEYEEIARRTDELVATLDLDAAYPLPEAPWFPRGATRSVRRTFLHVIAETAQHAGHADILRESIDGQKTMG